MDDLIRQLDHKDAEVREDAIRKLCNIGGPAVIEPLLKALRDEDETLGNIAATYFRRSPDIRILEPVIELIREGRDP